MDTTRLKKLAGIQLTENEMMVPEVPQGQVPPDVMDELVALMDLAEQQGLIKALSWLQSELGGEPGM